MATYSIKFKVTDLTQIKDDAYDLEIYFNDLLQNTVLPALGMELVPVTLEVKKSRR